MKKITSLAIIVALFAVSAIQAQTSSTTITNQSVSLVTNAPVIITHPTTDTYTTTAPATPPAVPGQTQVPNLLGTLGLPLASTTGISVGGVSLGAISSMLQNGIITVG